MKHKSSCLLRQSQNFVVPKWTCGPCLKNLKEADFRICVFCWSKSKSTKVFSWHVSFTTGPKFPRSYGDLLCTGWLPLVFFPHRGQFLSASQAIPYIMVIFQWLIQFCTSYCSNVDQQIYWRDPTKTLLDALPVSTLPRGRQCSAKVFKIDTCRIPRVQLKQTRIFKAITKKSPSRISWTKQSMKIASVLLYNTASCVTYQRNLLYEFQTDVKSKEKGSCEFFCYGTQIAEKNDQLSYCNTGTAETYIFLHQFHEPKVQSLKL